MLLLILLTVLVLSLGHWLFSPFIDALTPLFSLAWFPWVALALGLWLLSGAGSDEEPGN